MFNNKKYLLISGLFSLILILLFFQYYSSQKHGDSQSIDEVILTTAVPSSAENEFIPSE